MVSTWLVPGQEKHQILICQSVKRFSCTLNILPIKLLATNESMHKLLENFVHNITLKFEEKFKVLGQKIEDQHSMIDKLEAKVPIQDNVIERLLVKSDDN